MNTLEERINILQMIVNRKTKLMLMNKSYMRIHNPLVDRIVQHDVLAALEDNNETDQWIAGRYL